MALVIVEFDDELLAIMPLSFDIMLLSLDIMPVSLDIMPPFMEPSTAVMLSDIVSMPSVAFMSVTVVLSVVVSVLGPHAETASAAPAIIEPVRTLEISARIGSSLDSGFGVACWP